jgi:hypothetical protein
LTVADFLSVLLVSLPFDSATPAAPSLSPPLAWSSPDDAEEGVDPGEPADEPDEDDEEEPAEDGESVDELDEPESDGPAHATPGVAATAAPTPKATAKPPTRPTYLGITHHDHLPVCVRNSS